MSLQKKISSLEHENSELKTRLRDVANIKGQQDVQAYMASHKVYKHIYKYIAYKHISWMAPEAGS
jgi:hypothetical protein